LNRFFALHVAAIPALMLLLAGAHLFLVRVLGISDPEKPPTESGKSMYKKTKYPRGMRFYPEFVMEDVLVIFIFLALFAVIVCFFPQWIFSGDAEIPADPFFTPERIKPEWYFLASYQFLKLVPSEFAALVLLTLAASIFVFLPFVDRSRENDIRKRPLFLLSVVTAIAFFLGLTIWGAIS
jgi:ubiquinol-cytochrome c reductase cytochrome b subunit